MLQTKNKFALLLIGSMIFLSSCDKDFDTPPVKELPEGNILTIDSVRKKVSKVIIDLSSKYDSQTLSLTREDLASMAGTARETVIRTLKDFKSEGLIEIKGGNIVILDFEKLTTLPH